MMGIKMGIQYEADEFVLALGGCEHEV